MTKYRALVGISYPGKSGEKRAEVGDLVSDLPPKSTKWLLEQGYIELPDAKVPSDENVDGEVDG